jgi:hypothetical protein
MNRAAARMMARAPLLSATSLRFLQMADISVREFLAGFRMRSGGECLYLFVPSYQSPPVVRKSRSHGGRGDFMSTGSGRIMLTYHTDRFSYVEEPIHAGPDLDKPDVRLTLWDRTVPDTILTVLPGRRLIDLIGTDHFLGTKSTRIVDATILTYPGSTALRLHLVPPWHAAARALPMMELQARRGRMSLKGMMERDAACR